MPTPTITAALPTLENGVGRGVLTAPAAWYEHPEADTYTRLTVTDDGQVYGHIAPWNAPHRGDPRVNSNQLRGDDFLSFHTGRVRTSEGGTIDVGHLTIGGGHASVDGDSRAAAEHYDNVATAWAHVRAVEGQHGIWVAGSVAPGVTDLMLHKAQAFPPSGDWRVSDVNGDIRRRLHACCAVVTPGFPVHELYALIASAGLGDGEPARLTASAADWQGITAAGELPDLGGPPFRVLIFPEGEVSRDGRSIDQGATVWADGEPMPLWYKREEGGQGHDGAVQVGRIDSVYRDEQSRVWGEGQFIGDPAFVEAAEAVALVEMRVLLGVSGDLGEMRGTYLGGEIELWSEDDEDGDGDPDVLVFPDEPFDSAEPWMTVQYAELVGATLTGKEAFADCRIELLSAPAVAVEEPVAASAARAWRSAGRRRVLPFRVVGRQRPQTAPTVSVEDRMAALERTAQTQAQVIATLTAERRERELAQRTAALSRLGDTATLRQRVRDGLLERLRG